MPASKVTITFDGLFLLRQRGSVCEVNICTAALGHHMEIIVLKQGGRVRYPSNNPNDFFTIENLRGFRTLSLDVFDNTGTSLPPSVVKEDFGLFLNLAQTRFYGTTVQLNQGRYECQFLLNHGTIRPGNLAEVGSADFACRQVKLAALEDVRFRTPLNEWRQILREKRASDPQSIQDFSALFAKDAQVIISLEEGEEFRITKGDGSNSSIIAPLRGIAGKNYDVHIKYDDAVRPDTLRDCKGLGHHFDAVRPSGEQTIWAVFRPFRSHETTPGCCEFGCLLP